MSLTSEQQCLWSQEDHNEDVWQTECGEQFVFSAPGGPIDHDFSYCCFCGAGLWVKS